jgi:hypothetical protein
MLLRVTTSESDDDGGRSTAEIEPRRWTHLTFVFDNATSAEPGEPSFRYSL